MRTEALKSPRLQLFDNGRRQVFLDIVGAACHDDLVKVVRLVCDVMREGRGSSSTIAWMRRHG